MKKIKFSVLMSVYKNEKKENLKQSLDSLLNQTLLPNEIILVEDGPLTNDLYELIDQYKKTNSIIKVIKLKQNVGLGLALNEGLKKCKFEYVARMDSDDISVKTRFEKQISYLINNPDITIVGSVIKEFSGNIKNSDTMRIVPEYNDEIYLFAKKRNPFNHPSVIFCKQAVLSVGSYKDVRNLQDYFLWVDLILAGYKGYNIQEPLVYMRADENLFKRRSGKKYILLQKKLLKYMKENKFINDFEFIKSMIIRTCSGYAPNWLRQFIFKKLLRKKS